MNDQKGPKSANGSEIRIERVRVDRIVDLRHGVLRQGLPREAAVFEGDQDPAAVHVAAIAGDAVVGCATLHPSRWEDQPAWQLRGMAVAEAYRNGGIGGELVRAILEHVDAETPGRTVWANARVPAARFYQKLGWEIVSDVFEIPTAGPHVQIIRRG
jgi:predicted GNAT family N-acyltransferase